MSESVEIAVNFVRQHWRRPEAGYLELEGL